MMLSRKAIRAVMVEDRPFSIGRHRRTTSRNAAVFLSSERSRYITGVVLPVDGGMTAGNPRNALAKILAESRPCPEHRKRTPEKHERHRSSQQSEIAQWDPEFTAKIKDQVYPLVRRWFRSEVRGMELIAPSAALVVSNHSGGMFTPDPLIFGADFYEKFGYERPARTRWRTTRC